MQIAKICFPIMLSISFVTAPFSTGGPSGGGRLQQAASALFGQNRPPGSGASGYYNTGQQGAYAGYNTGPQAPPGAYTGFTGPQQPPGAGMSAYHSAHTPPHTGYVSGSQSGWSPHVVHAAPQGVQGVGGFGDPNRHHVQHSAHRPQVGEAGSVDYLPNPYQQGAQGPPAGYPGGYNPGYTGGY